MTVVINFFFSFRAFNSSSASNPSKQRRPRQGKNKDNSKQDPSSGGAKSVAANSGSAMDNLTFPTSRGLVSRPVRFA